MSFSGKSGGVRERLGIVDGDLLNFVMKDLIDLGDNCGGASTLLGGVTAASRARGIRGVSDGGSIGLLELRWFRVEEAR